MFSCECGFRVLLVFLLGIQKYAMKAPICVSHELPLNPRPFFLNPVLVFPKPQTLTNPWGVPGDHGAAEQKKLLQKHESLANTSDFALAQQSYALRNMLFSRVLMAGTCAREDFRKHGLGIILTRKHARTRGFVLWECGVRLENITKPRGCMVYPQEGTEFIGVCSTSYTSTRTQNPYSRLFFRFKVLGFLC